MEFPIWKVEPRNFKVELSILETVQQVMFHTVIHYGSIIDELNYSHYTDYNYDFRLTSYAELRSHLLCRSLTLTSFVVD